MFPYINHSNRQIYVDLFPLVSARLEETILTANVASGASTLTVKDINGFAINKILLLGELGEEGAEIIKTHGSTAPTGTTITLASNTVFAHSAQTKVYIVEFDNIEFSHSATLTGSKSVLATSAIQADQLIQAYTDTTQTSGYYFARFKETIGSTFGSYTDGVPYGGWSANQVGYLVDKSLRNLKETLSDIITIADCMSWINDGLRYVQGKLKTFPQYQKLNSIVGSSSLGQFSITMPSDIYDSTTNRSIRTLRLGKHGNTLRFLHPDEFQARQGNVRKTQVTTQAVATDTSLAIDNSYDFDDDGTVSVYISGTKYDITYTGVTRSATAGVLTGIPASGDGSITVTIPVDTYVYQNQEEGRPLFYTVTNDQIEYSPMADSTYVNNNFYMDYLTEADQANSLGDEIDAQRYDLMQDYLTWRIKMKKHNSSNLDLTDGWFLSFKEKLNDYIRTVVPLFKRKMRPNINRVNYRRTYGRTWDINNDGE